MEYLFYITVIVINTFILAKKPEGIIPFIVFVYIFIQFFILKLFPNSILYKYLTQIIIAYSLIYASIIKYKLGFFIKQPITIFFIFTQLFLCFLALYKDINLINYINYHRSCTLITFIFVYILILKPDNYEKKWIKILVLTVIIELFFSLSQYYIPNEFLEYITIEHIYYSNARLISGTFRRFNMLGNFISVIITYIFGYLLFNSRELKIIDRIILLIVVFISSYVVFLTGCRTSVMSLFAGFGLIIFLKYKKISISFLIICLLIGMSYIFSFEEEIKYAAKYNKARKYDNPIERVVGGTLVMIDEINNFNEEEYKTSLGLSIIVSFLIKENPLFGGNILFSDKSMPTKRGEPFADHLTDSTLMLGIAEFGLIGFGFIMIPFFYFLFVIKIKCSKSDFKINLAMFLVLLLQTFSDPGFFFKEASYIYIVTTGFQYLKE